MLTACSNQLLVIAILIISGITNCSPKKKGEQENVPAAPKLINKKPASSFADTLKIKGPAAVFFNPDTAQWQQLKKTTSDQVFESNQHDCFYQQRNARLVLKQYWPQIAIIEAVHKRFLLFVNEKQSPVITDLDASTDWCGVILYKEGKQPQIIDMTNIETALNYYFNE